MTMVKMSIFKLTIVILINQYDYSQFEYSYDK